MKTYSIKKTFSTYIIIVFLVILMMFVSMSVILFNSSISEISENQSISNLNSISSLIYRYVGNNRIMVKNLASDKFLINGLVNRKYYFSDTIEYLKNYKFSDENYPTKVFDFKGETLVSIGEEIPLSEKGKIIQLLDGSINGFSDAIVVDGVSYIRIYEPIKSQKSIQGGIMVALPLRENLFNSVSIGANDLFYLKDRNENILIEIGNVDSEFKNVFIKETDSEYTRKLNDIGIELFYITVPSELIKLRNEFIKIIITVGLISVLIAIWMSLKFGNKYFVKPLSMLQKKVSNIGKTGEEFNVDLKIESSISEIDVLNKAFDKTSKEIISYQNELENNLNELEQAKNQIVEAEKLAALGHLVAGIAHEVNTPLGVSVTANSYIIKSVNKITDKLGSGELSREDLNKYLSAISNSSEMLENNLNRAATLIGDFKSISSTQITGVIEKFNFKNYLNKICNVLLPLYKRKVSKIIIECDDEMEIKNKEGVFSQIFTNLINNSVIHGMKDLEVGNIKISVFERENEYEVVYYDNGCGISEDIMSKVFEPFFTTDRSGGVGLGLFITYNLIRNELNGNILIKNCEQGGMKFIITWPK